MSTPVVVVQGTPVASAAPVAEQTYSNTQQNADSSFTGKGEKQETKCRDPIFAVLFYGAVAAIVAVAALYGPDALNADSGSLSDFSGYIWAVIICVIASFVGAGAGMAILMRIPETLIKVALILSVVMAAVWMALAFAYGQWGIGIVGAIFFVISCCYAYAVWSRIPFATVNLVTAITAIKANLGVALYAYFLTAIAAGWALGWSVAFVGVFDQTYNCDATGVCTNPNYGYLFGLFVAFFFVDQVLENSIHVTVAGTVGTWWFDPEEGKGFCTPACNNAFLRTITTSFGSICFGSLIVAILEALRMLANTAQNSGDADFLACIAECILNCLARIVEYFNKWAFVYVGLYGYSYLQAGKNVFTLFKNRGWEAIIADDLVTNALFLISVVVGGIMGCIGLILAATTDWFDSAGEINAKATAFVLGFFVGLVITNILMNTISSAVNAIIVLFAEAPAEFQQNYPELSNRMRETWSQVYPGSV